MTPSPRPSPRIPSQLCVHRKSRRILSVVRRNGRTVWCSWFPDGEDPKKPGAKLQTAPFWEHQLNFDVAAVRARAEELGLADAPPPPPDPGAGNM